MKKLIFNNAIILAIIFTLFINFPMYVTGTTISNIVSLSRMFLMLIIFIMYIKNNRISKIIIYVIIFELILIFSTFINGNKDMIITSINYAASVLCICCITEMGIKYNPKKFFKAGYYTLAIFTIINCITFYIYYPNGMPTGIYGDIRGDINYYFLGHDNGSLYYIIPTLIFGAIYNYLKYDKLSFKFILLIIFFIISYLYIWSVNAVIIIVCFLLFALTYNSKKYEKILNPKIFILIYIVLFLSIVVFNTENSILSNILDYLKRDATISGRTGIWQKAFYYINNQPLIGYGYEEINILLIKFNIGKLHNIFVQILYNGGYLAFFTYFLIFISSTKKAFKNIKSKFSKIILATIYLTLLSCLFDYYIYAFYLYILFIIAYYSNDLVGDKK